MVPRLAGIGSKVWKPPVLQTANPWFQDLQALVPRLGNIVSKVWELSVPQTGTPWSQDWEALVPRFGNQQFLKQVSVVPRFASIGSKVWEPAVPQSGNVWLQKFGIIDGTSGKRLFLELRIREPKIGKNCCQRLGSRGFKVGQHSCKLSIKTIKLFKFVCFADHQAKQQDHQAKQQKRTQQMFVESDAYV